MTPISSTTRHFTASIVVVDPRTASVLLIHHRATDKLMFPGGHIDQDETPCEAALREVLEETGIHAAIAGQDPLGLPGMTQLASPWAVYEIPAPPKPNRPGKPAEPAHHHIDFLYLGTADSSTAPAALESEVSTAAWYPVNNIPADAARAEVQLVALRAYHAITGA